MNKKIYTIILVNNNSLFGGINDYKLIYNVFYNFYLNKSNWTKPYVLLNNDLKINNLLNIIKSISYEQCYIIFYFSGHSNIHGELKFYDNYISNNFLFNLISNNINNYIDIVFFIDSCFSEKFTIINNYNLFFNIKKISFLVSSKENEKSKEFTVKYDKQLFKYNKIDEKNIIPIGIFTYYLCHYLKDIETIDDIDIIYRKSIWKFISDKYKQTIVFREYINK